MNSETRYFVIRTEPLWQSIAKDIFTFGCLAFCMYLSWGSRGWSIICAGMFFTFLLGIVITTSRSKEFKSTKALAEWVQKEMAEK